MTLTVLRAPPTPPNLYALLVRAVSGDDPDALRVLLKDHASPLPIDEQGQGFSVLRAAAERGNTVCLQMLLDHGEAVDHAGTDGWTALMSATTNGHAPSVEVLVRYGANLHIKDTAFGQTALHMAADLDRLMMLAVLVQAGASLTERDRAGCTAYDLADQNGYARARTFLGEALARQESAVLRSDLDVLNERSVAKQDDASQAVERRRL